MTKYKFVKVLATASARERQHVIRVHLDKLHARSVCPSSRALTSIGCKGAHVERAEKNRTDSSAQVGYSTGMGHTAGMGVTGMAGTGTVSRCATRGRTVPVSAVYGSILPSRRHITITDYNSVIQQYKVSLPQRVQMLSSSLQPIADNVVKRVKLVLPQAKDDEADLNALKKTWRSVVYSFFKLDAVTVQYHDERLDLFDSMQALQAGYALFSRNSASVYAVIPAMDKLDNHMNNVETKEKF
ncbi:uncharacterized protein BJ212DRAFT_1303745 [Suillus subaureus]|uniref:Uncharacterized protein n=1 Tax=Suillus subaureus TaxID=48587 RepID=A0A9P7DYE2_9AGAM|nr:uncharacterized protein BJ212DRAFT_1303745 [Suillus subaureus]KAG1806078.1 hypothetical protein BJ212DRAFT_1303745 [Suillus subaureus]